MSVSSVTSASALVQHLIRHGKAGVGKTKSLGFAETVDDFEEIHGNQYGFLPLRLLPPLPLLHSTISDSDINGNDDYSSENPDSIVQLAFFNNYKLPTRTQSKSKGIKIKFPLLKKCN